MGKGRGLVVWLTQLRSPVPPGKEAAVPWGRGRVDLAEAVGLTAEAHPCCHHCGVRVSMGELRGMGIHCGGLSVALGSMA